MENSSNYLSASRAVVSLGAWPVAPRPGEALVANAVAYSQDGIKLLLFSREDRIMGQVLGHRGREVESKEDTGSFFPFSFLRHIWEIAFH